MEHKIGEIITLPNGRKAEVVEGDTCHFCIFDCGELDCRLGGSRYAGSCTSVSRTDHKNIIYKEIKED